LDWVPKRKRLVQTWNKGGCPRISVDDLKFGGGGDPVVGSLQSTSEKKKGKQAVLKSRGEDRSGIDEKGKKHQLTKKQTKQKDWRRREMGFDKVGRIPVENKGGLVTGGKSDVPGALDIEEAKKKRAKNIHRHKFGSPGPKSPDRGEVPNILEGKRSGHKKMGREVKA